MSRAYFSSDTSLKIERNGNAGTSERFTVSFFGVMAKGETLERALGKVAVRLENRAEALSLLPSAALSEAGAAEKAHLLDLFALTDKA